MVTYKINPLYIICGYLIVGMVATIFEYGDVLLFVSFGFGLYCMCTFPQYLIESGDDKIVAIIIVFIVFAVGMCVFGEILSFVLYVIKLIF